MLLFIDNFDSFTYTLVQYFQVLGVETTVVREGAKSVDECLTLNPRYIVIGPGPGAPSQAKLSKDLISISSHNLPLLGICLGHQALAEYYGGVVDRARKPMHGKTSSITHTGEGLFFGIPQGFSATRYHSLIVQEANLPDCLEITAWAENREIMGLRHRHLKQQSIQFHPESILTEWGFTLLKNFLK